MAEPEAEPRPVQTLKNFRLSLHCGGRGPGVPETPTHSQPRHTFPYVGSVAGSSGRLSFPVNFRSCRPRTVTGGGQEMLDVGAPGDKKARGHGALPRESLGGGSPATRARCLHRAS